METHPTPASNGGSLALGASSLGQLDSEHGSPTVSPEEARNVVSTTMSAMFGLLLDSSDSGWDTNVARGLQTGISPGSADMLHASELSSGGTPRNLMPAFEGIPYDEENGEQGWSVADVSNSGQHSDRRGMIANRVSGTYSIRKYIGYAYPDLVLTS
jgi:hypothetical protein